MSDYWLVRGRKLDIDSLYSKGSNSIYWYKVGQGQGQGGAARPGRVGPGRAGSGRLGCGLSRRGRLARGAARHGTGAVLRRAAAGPGQRGAGGLPPSPNAPHQPPPGAMIAYAPGPRPLMSSASPSACVRPVALSPCATAPFPTTPPGPLPAAAASRTGGTRPPCGPWPSAWRPRCPASPPPWASPRGCHRQVPPPPWGRHGCVGRAC